MNVLLVPKNAKGTRCKTSKTTNMSVSRKEWPPCLSFGYFNDIRGFLCVFSSFGRSQILKLYATFSKRCNCPYVVSLTLSPVQCLVSFSFFSFLLEGVPGKLKSLSSPVQKTNKAAKQWTAFSKTLLTDFTKAKTLEDMTVHRQKKKKTPIYPREKETARQRQTQQSRAPAHTNTNYFLWRHL